MPSTFKGLVIWALILVGCIGPTTTYNPCSDSLSWRIDDGRDVPVFHNAWHRAMGMWAEHGVRFDANPSDNPLVRVRVIPGVFADKKVSGLTQTRWDPVEGQFFRVTVDAAKTQTYTSLSGTLAHEVGHVLGLEHYEGGIMCAYCDEYEVTSVDVEALRGLCQ